MKTRYIRHAMLASVLGLVVYLALGFGSRSFEAYCPFGGVESLWGVLTTGEFSCALGPLNLSMMIAALALALLAKKAFCGWACPIGFLGELAAGFGGQLWKRRPLVPSKADGRLKLLRYAVLGVALFFTYRAGELVLRGYDPFYLIFSGLGHGSAGVLSVVVLGAVAPGSGQAREVLLQFPTGFAQQRALDWPAKERERNQPANHGKRHVESEMSSFA